VNIHLDPLGVATNLPLKELQVLKETGLAGAVFNDRAAGGLIARSTCLRG
jgi:hypothetical protein